MEMDEMFTDDYNNPSSEKYLEFVKRCRENVNPIYDRHIPTFERVDNINLSAGGQMSQQNRHKGKRSLPFKQNERRFRLKFKHDAICTIKNDENAIGAYNNVLDQLNMALKDLKVNSTADFRVINASSSRTELSVYFYLFTFIVFIIYVNCFFISPAKEVCVVAAQNISVNIPKDFEAVVLDGKVTCVTPCHNDHPRPKLCMHYGTCTFAEQGPICNCHHTEAYWFLGDNCRIQVHKVGLYAGLGTVAAIAVITIAILTAYLVINKRTVKRNKDIKQELVKEWLDDDFEWPPQKKTSDDTYYNPVYSHKQGSLGKPDFSAARFYTRNFSPDPDIHLRYLQIDQPMRMDRPQIRSSFDI
ncbi:uncharacterized protein LOC143737848 [Siphateles boraxobius]|uniref:uncharacterized protein LOC143737848 n=1 Tax=Siphateles boraxobius TaxID=180520 RepID=UPI00406339EA